MTRVGDLGRRSNRTLIAIAVAAGLGPTGCRERGEARVTEGSAAASGPAPIPRAPPSATAAAPAVACDPACFSIERCVAGRCVPSCPGGEVYVPRTGAAGFEMGRGAPGTDDQKHTVVLTKPFCIDATEVTVTAYRSCVERGACTLPQLRDRNSNYRVELDRPNHPLNMVNHKQATAYCKAHDKALPTEAQWEYAASRGEGRRYPWGDAPDPTCENGLADFTPGGSPKTDPAGNVGCHGGGSSEVEAHPEGKVSWPDGDVFDMAGNVWEWTADCYLPYPREKVTDPSPVEHPNLDGDCYVWALRGGGWNRSKSALQTFWRAGSKWTYRVPGLGFRCVRNPK